MRKEIRHKIVAQALEEIEFARRHKQGRIASWHKTEDLYYAKKQKSEDARANVELGQMQSFVHTLMSKIDDSLSFTFVKRKLAQLKRVQRLNSLKIFDSKRDFWNMKDLVGKKQAILYGRAIYFYSASSVDAYRPSLEPVDVYDFLIDPAAGGLDVEVARYLGRYGIVKSEKDLKEGVKNKQYIPGEVEELLRSNGNATEETSEDTNKQNREYGNNTSGSDKEMSNNGKYKFWEWFTTYEGVRYYLLLTPTAGKAIIVDEWKKRSTKNTWPVWTWACFPDLTEFWTPSYAEYVRETMMAQSVSINQLIDNSTQRNKPQRLVNVGAIENLAELKYRNEGYIKVKAEFDVQKAMQIVEVPSIDTPLKVYDILASIQDRNSGVTAGTQGVADDKGKATIYEGNQANAADRFGLLNKSYSFGYQRFAMLYENGVREHMTSKMAVEILGPDGVEIMDIDKDDIFEISGESFGVVVESSQAETSLSTLEQKMKEGFLASLINNPTINQQKVLELRAKLAGFDEEDIKQLLQTDEFGTEEMFAEADRDIEMLLQGLQIKVNANANTAYKQRFVDYMKDNEEDITGEQFAMLSDYVSQLGQIIDQNMIRSLQEERLKAIKTAPQVGPDGKPVSLPVTNEEQTLNKIKTV
jgi:hypothetical protein